MKDLNFLKATVVNTFLTYLRNPNNANMTKYYPQSAAGSDACTGSYGEIAKAIYNDITCNKASNPRLSKCIDALAIDWTPQFVLDIIDRNHRMSPISMEDVILADTNDRDILTFAPGVDFSANPIVKASDASSVAGLRIEQDSLRKVKQ